MSQTMSQNPPWTRHNPRKPLMLLVGAWGFEL
jgi:hypothetical protein